MKKPLIKLAFIALCFTPIVAFANSQSYQNTMNQINKTQSTLTQCLKTKSNIKWGECYSNASDKYEDIIKTIREKNKDKLDQKLWHSINLGYANQIQNCRNQNFYTGKFQDPEISFYPYLSCYSTNMHSFAIATAELHLKGMS